MCEYKRIFPLPTANKFLEHTINLEHSCFNIFHIDIRFFRLVLVSRGWDGELSSADEQKQRRRIRTGLLLPGKQGYADVTCAITFDISKGRVEVSFPPSEDRHPFPRWPQHPAEMCTAHKRSTLCNLQVTNEFRPRPCKNLMCETLLTFSPLPSFRFFLKLSKSNAKMPGHFRRPGGHLYPW